LNLFFTRGRHPPETTTKDREPRAPIVAVVNPRMKGALMDSL
jgi:hypothetical protein